MSTFPSTIKAQARRSCPWITSIALVLFVITAFMLVSTIPTPAPNPNDHVRAANIDGVWYYFNPDDVASQRWDLFQAGYFSLFDILVNLAADGKIQLEYHFNETLDTHIIDSLNGHPYWWYFALYEGGWQEDNAHRIDYYPWKNGTQLFLYHTTASYLNQIYGAFAEQAQRRSENPAQLVIPKVFIESLAGSIEFENVTVTAHNLRNDLLRTGTITAIDVILSLGDQGLITYNLQWFESIGSVGYVRSYWVQTINGEQAHGRCGWVYESGSLDTVGQNHIHVPSDTRILFSPYYVSWFWICL